MPDLLPKALSDETIDRAELDAIFARFDIDKSGHLEANELQLLARAIADLTSGVADDILQIMDFYHIEYDEGFSRAELKDFLECHVAEALDKG